MRKICLAALMAIGALASQSWAQQREFDNPLTAEAEALGYVPEQPPARMRNLLVQPAGSMYSLGGYAPATNVGWGGGGYGFAGGPGYGHGSTGGWGNAGGGWGNYGGYGGGWGGVGTGGGGCCAKVWNGYTPRCYGHHNKGWHKHGRGCGCPAASPCATGACGASTSDCGCEAADDCCDPCRKHAWLSGWKHRLHARCAPDTCCTASAGCQTCQAGNGGGPEMIEAVPSGAPVPTPALTPEPPGPSPGPVETPGPTKATRNGRRLPWSVGSLGTNKAT